MKSLHIFVIGLILSLTAGDLLSKQDGDPVSIGTYRVIHSDILKEKRTLLVHLPRDYKKNQEKHYPVLYLLYGNHTTTYFAETVSILQVLGNNGDIPEMILVGIENTDRYRDLLPKTRTGKETGIENFIGFLRNELFPWVDKHYRTEPYKLIMGPQAGSNFVFYTLFKYPNLFNGGIGQNPFRWSSGRAFIIDLAKKKLNGEADFKQTLYFTCNDNDGLERKGSNVMAEFESFLKKNKQPAFHFQVNYIRNWTEFLAPFDLRRGLKFLFRNYKLKMDQNFRGLPDIKKHFSRLSKELGYRVKIPEHILTRAYDRLKRTDSNAAMMVLSSLRQIYPKSVNGLWRTADLQVAKGNLKQAIRTLEKAMIYMGSDSGMVTNRIKRLKRTMTSSAAFFLRKSIDKDGLASATQLLQQLDNQKSIYFSEIELNALGYIYINGKRYPEAEWVFRIAIDKYPQSANLHDSLGELMFLTKRYHMSAQLYQKVLELAPNSPNAKKMLEQIRNIRK